MVEKRKNNKLANSQVIKVAGWLKESWQRLLRKIANIRKSAARGPDLFAEDGS